ncbi:MAG: hypothetical protein HRT58_20820 [Crocinitomicaceae bacterium]|nr:hypothetical protein [Flavobacteriales bacterium]NQZ38116.1 hypothetical protein [Crocinitomicaceae bacterium]
MSFKDNDYTKTAQLFVIKVNDEYNRGEKIDNSFWKNKYEQLHFKKRCDLWWIQIARYEHRVHAEFDENSINKVVLFLSSAIKEKDSNSDQILVYLKERLAKTGLQNPKMSDYMIVCFNKQTCN